MMNKWQIVSRLTLSLAIFMMSLSILYFSWVIYSVNASIPMVADKIEQASNAVNSAVNQVNTLSNDISAGLIEFEKINALIPKILSESAEVRSQTNLVLLKASEFNDRIPSLLDESRNIRESIPLILEDIARTRDTVDKSMAELRRLREEIPGLMADANALIEKADKAGIKASEGAVSGVFTGIVKAPYNIIRNVVIKEGSGTRELTVRDRSILTGTVKKLLRNDTLGERLKFENEVTNLTGFVELVSQSSEENEPCRSVRIVIGKSYDLTKRICQDADKQWYLYDDQ